MQRAVTIWSEGSRLVADVFAPDDARDDQPCKHYDVYPAYFEQSCCVAADFFQNAFVWTVNMIELSGRTAVITGGASGIGLALAKRLSGVRPDTRSRKRVLRRCGNDGPGDIGRSLLYLYARIPTWPSISSASGHGIRCKSFNDHA
jgi:hypothetical protein